MKLLKKDIAYLNRNPDEKNEVRDIMICSGTDGYQNLETQNGITRDVITELKANDLPFTVLTKNTNVLNDINLFKGYDKCRVGFTVITLDDELRRLLEPNSSPIKARIDGFKQLKEAGISTYCSVEPIMPDPRSNPIEIVEKLRGYVDLFELGKWNGKPRKFIKDNTGIVYNEDYYLGVFSELIPYLEKEGIRYCVAKHSQDYLREHGFRFIPALLVSDKPYPAPTAGDFTCCVHVDDTSGSTSKSSQAAILSKNPSKSHRIKLNKKSAINRFENGEIPIDLARISGITRATLNRYYREWKSR